MNNKGIFLHKYMKNIQNQVFDLMLLNKNVLLIIQKGELNFLSILQRFVENGNRKWKSLNRKVTQ